MACWTASTTRWTAWSTASRTATGFASSQFPIRTCAKCKRYQQLRPGIWHDLGKHLQRNHELRHQRHPWHVRVHPSLGGRERPPDPAIADGAEARIEIERLLHQRRGAGNQGQIVLVWSV